MTYDQLAAAKQRIEDGVDYLSTMLFDGYKFDMDLPLVIDGFPRSDVDVVTVRLIRSKIIRLRNDHSAVMSQLQHHLTQQLKVHNTSDDYNEKLSPKASFRPEIINPKAQAFAFVRAVDSGSPAAKAGLLAGDRIVIFDGDIKFENHDNLKAVAYRVKVKKDTEVSVEILRGSGERNRLHLIPTEKWAGRGLLGCHIVPL